MTSGPRHRRDVPFDWTPPGVYAVLTALARVALTAAMLLICLGFRYLSSASSRATLLTVVAVGAYLLFGMAWLMLVKRHPGTFVSRRATVIVGDLTITSFGVYMMGELGASFYPLYLWIIVGNGMRYGPRYMYAATSTGVFAFAVVLVLSDYWHDKIAMGLSLLVGLIVLPLFYLHLIHRLHASTRRGRGARQAEAARKPERLSRDMTTRFASIMLIEIRAFSSTLRGRLSSASIRTAAVGRCAVSIITTSRLSKIESGRWRSRRSNSTCRGCEDALDLLAEQSHAGDRARLRIPRRAATPTGSGAASADPANWPERAQVHEESA